MTPNTVFGLGMFIVIAACFLALPALLWATANNLLARIFAATVTAGVVLCIVGVAADLISRGAA